MHGFDEPDDDKGKVDEFLEEKAKEEKVLN